MQERCHTASGISNKLREIGRGWGSPEAVWKDMDRGSGSHPLFSGTVEMMGGSWPTQGVQGATAGGGSFSQSLVGLTAAVISLLFLPGREERKR